MEKIRVVLEVDVEATSLGEAEELVSTLVSDQFEDSVDVYRWDVVSAAKLLEE